MFQKKLVMINSEYYTTKCQSFHLLVDPVLLKSTGVSSTVDSHFNYTYLVKTVSCITCVNV